MCGICGVFNLRHGDPVKRSVMENMLRAIGHRGPDGHRIEILEQAALGFNRLGFLDLESGMQPIENEDRTIIMICNGEIFNYQTLKNELAARGHIFKTKTDVEVLIHLYEEEDLDFVKRLNGQFALALYDKRKRQMVLVRDQMGIAPLFYTIVDEKLIFASEIKAILEYPHVKRKLNLKAVDQLMNFPGVVSPETFFEGIYSLECGHMIRAVWEDKVTDMEYWDLNYHLEQEDRGEEYYVEKLRELLKEAISRRLVADVPIGFYISGGLDSSVVACFIGKYLLNSCYSFSAEIGSGELDESRFQKTIQNYVNSFHSSVAVTEKELWENLSDIIYYGEAAVKESYDVAAYLLSGLVKYSPAKAVLTGQGSDEFFYGYAGYVIDVFRTMQKDQMSREECEVNERLWGDPYFRYERNHPAIRKIHTQIYSKELRGEIDSFSSWNSSPVKTDRLKGLSTSQRRSYIDYKLRLSDHLLIEHGDHMFFSHSIEGRHPFLDHELISFVTSVPDQYKLKGTNEKYILKQAAKGIVPDEILKRKKFPFQAPGMSAMIKRAEGDEFLNDRLIREQRIFDADYVKKMKSAYREKGFKLMGAYEIDYLLIVTTVTMLCQRFSLSI